MRSSGRVYCRALDRLLARQGVYAAAKRVVVLVALLIHTPLLAFSQPGVPFDQLPEQMYLEMQTVYYGNLARQENGLPPLRWNAPMTAAARWFDWDSIENRPDEYCGHQDTLDRWPGDRVPLFGYRGACGAENCYCGYLLPQDAIAGWMNSPWHRANLLDSHSREIGMGYYLRAGDGRGYLTQDFGHDALYPPVIVNREAVNTTSTAVDLYIYDREPGGGFAGLGPAVEMQVANEPCFSGVSWEPYAAQKPWSLKDGVGWRTVYVRTRDAVGRSTVVSDTIYLGAPVPLNQLGLHLASSGVGQVTLYDLDASWPRVQLSQNWFVDDQFETFELLWGNGERIADPEAKGGTAFRLRPGDGESSVWVWTTEFHKNVPLVAYARLKVSDNSSVDEVARFLVKGGGVEYGPLSLRGSDFAAADVYQEFPLAFVFHEHADDLFLIFQLWRSCDAEVVVDGVTIWAASQATHSPLTWQIPGGNYRGGGVWVRYVDGAGAFSDLQQANLTPLRLTVSPTDLTLIAEAGTVSTAGALQVVRSGCEPFTSTVRSDAAWLQAQPDGERVQLQVDASHLALGTYGATVTVEAGPRVLGSPISVPVHLLVIRERHSAFLPLAIGGHGLGFSTARPMTE